MKTKTMRKSPSAPRPVQSEGLPPRALARGAVGGALMGVANLIPGVSGGTMLVAAGAYTRFIDAISDVTRLRLRPPSLVFLSIVVAAAGVAIGALAGVIEAGLTGFRWGMYSLFIGLTLGGVPVMLRMTRPFTRGAAIGAAAGVAVMIALIMLQEMGAGGRGARAGGLMLVLAGIAGASAMILPGVSGAYLLLLLGQYERIITSIKDFAAAGAGGDVSAAMGELAVLAPVGIGVVVGVVGVGNLLRFVLQRFEKPTLGVLLGLLIAAPIGLYPFRAGVEPTPGDVIAGQTVTEDNLPEFLEDPKDWEQRFFAPTAGHIGGAIALIAIGFAATASLARLGGEGEHASDQDEPSDAPG